MKKVLLGASIILFSLCTQTALAEVGMGLRGGTMGYGVDFNVGLLEKLNFRLGYNYFNYSQTVEDTNVNYDGTIKINSISGVLDWHAFGNGFRFSLGAVGAGPKVDIVGTPSGGSYTIGNTTYTAAEVGSLRGQIKIGNSVAPFIGIGYGNVVSEKHRVTFLIDFGAVYGGDPEVTLAAQCGAGIPTNRCTQLQNDAAVEIQKLKDDVTEVQWYPVINIGIGIRF